MKLVTKALIIATALTLSSVVMHSFAMIHSKDRGQLIMHYFNIAPTAYNAKAKIINCAPFSDQTYSLTTHNSAFKLAGEFSLRDAHFYSASENHGLISVHWRGIWTYDEPRDKHYTSHIHGVEIMAKNSNVKFGLMANKYCMGAYKTTWSATTK